jgi:tyrosyl-tRNA synthetase
MSKSLGNAIGITEQPDEIFGKIMSISDELMDRWLDLLTPDEAPSARAALADGTLHPREAKARLAHAQVARFHSPDAAAAARERFDERFARGGLPEEMVGHWESSDPVGAELALPALLTKSGLTKSNGEARRLIAQRGVRLDDAVVEAERVPTAALECDQDGRPIMLIQVGKRRACRIRLGPRRA